DRKRLAGETLNVQTKRLIRFAGKDQQALSIRKEPGPLIVEPGPRKLDGGALADRHEAEARAILNPERKGKFAVGRKGHGTPFTKADGGSVGEPMKVDHVLLGAGADAAFIEQHHAAVHGDVSHMRPVLPR